MTQAQAARVRALKTIEEEIESNKKQIEEEISRSGKNVHVDPSVLLFIAKNYNTIKKLEKK